MIQLVSYFAKFPEACEKKFLGLNPWYHYLEGDPGTCDVVNFKIFGSDSSVPLILLALIDDLLRVAGIVAVGFVIYGAVGFITSEGSPDKAARARETIVNALLGLAIAIVAIAFVTFLAGRLT